MNVVDRKKIENIQQQAEGEAYTNRIHSEARPLPDISPRSSFSRILHATHCPDQGGDIYNSS